MFDKIIFILMCLLVPVAWGITVNWLFDFWSVASPTPSKDGSVLNEQEDDQLPDDTIFPDYQI